MNEYHECANEVPLNGHVWVTSNRNKSSKILKKKTEINSLPFETWQWTLYSRFTVSINRYRSDWSLDYDRLLPFIVIHVYWNIPLNIFI